MVPSTPVLKGQLQREEWQGTLFPLAQYRVCPELVTHMVLEAPSFCTGDVNWESDLLVSLKANSLAVCAVL